MQPTSTARLEAQGVEIGRGDIVLIRTGQMAQCRAEGAWGAYAGGAAPGLALDTVGWIHDHDIAAIASDTWGAEVLPNETQDVFQPLHIILIVHMGLLVGEIFDLEALADRLRRGREVRVPVLGTPAADHRRRGLAREPAGDQVGRR